MATLKLDYDMDNWFNVYCEGLRVIKEILCFHVMEEQIFISKSGNHHVRLEIREELSCSEVVAVQQIMGSDSLRGAFNLRRIRRGQYNWNILFTESVKRLFRLSDIVDGKAECLKVHARANVRRTET